MNPARLANTLWHGAALAPHWRFRHASHRLQATQSALLRSILQRHAATQFGRAHGFDRLRTVTEFQHAVPLGTYDKLLPAIERIARGDRQVLTRDPVTHFVPTSGSTSARKLIPWTAGLQRDFNRAIDAWISDLFFRIPDLKKGRAYWSVSPAAPEEQNRESRVRIGLADDTNYLGGLAGLVIGRVMAVPSAVRHVWNTDNFRYLVLLHLLAAPDLRLFSVWHPTFLTLLLDSLPHHFEAVLHSLRTGLLMPPHPLPSPLQRELQGRFRADPSRARDLEALGPTRVDAFWPRLALISAWGDHATPERDDLTSRLPGARFQPKGLLATEAVVTIPFAGRTPLAATSHFFEFLDEAGAIRLAHELESAHRYEVIVTTNGGLYRYQLRDQVEVVDHFNELPCLRFVQRAGAQSDLRGEKLDPSFVSGVLDALTAPFADSLRFRLLGAESTENPPRYTLLLLSGTSLDLNQLAAELDTRLGENPHYRLCRFLGQLQAATVCLIHPDSLATYFAWRSSRSRSRKSGDLKPALLDSGPGLLRSFQVIASSSLQSSSSGIDTLPTALL